MTRTKKISSLLLLCCLAAFRIQAQEVLYDQQENNQLGAVKPAKVKPKRGGALSLPFMDDFSQLSKYPNATLWADSMVYVNSTNVDTTTCGWSNNLPVSYGVATFDGLNKYGVPYDTLVTSGAHGMADSLTSQPIDLSGKTLGDSIYLSFLYQPQGIGNAPEPNDSLCLYFFDGSNWIWEWSVPGTNIQPFKNKILLVPASCYTNAFRFRFINYATLTGFNDLWNLDYVRLNSGRNRNDTLLNDVAFQVLPSSVLKQYQSMPFEQFNGFQSAELAGQLGLQLKNNFNSLRNTNYNYRIDELLGGGNVLTPGNASFNFNANSCIHLLIPNFTPATFTGNSALIQTTGYIASQLGDINAHNDTILHRQLLSNYYAYDDGSAEKAYGLLGAGAKFAYQFTVNVADTLRAIQIHFSHFNTDVQQKFFSIMVWSGISAGSSNETILYEEDFIHPSYVDSVNGFATYVLQNPYLVSPGTYYIGWLQTYTDMLNIGFDLNHDASSRMFYNTNGTWQNTLFHGALLLRPLLGSAIPNVAGIDHPVETPSVAVYPNPAGNQIRLAGVNLHSGDLMEVLNMLGQPVLTKTPQSPGDQAMEVSSLAPGLYLLRIRSGNRVMTSRFVKE